MLEGLPAHPTKRVFCPGMRAPRIKDEPCAFSPHPAKAVALIPEPGGCQGTKSGQWPAVSHLGHRNAQTVISFGYPISKPAARLIETARPDIRIEHP
jgi:hypothetical protein